MKKLNILPVLFVVCAAQLQACGNSTANTESSDSTAMAAQNVNATAVSNEQPLESSAEVSNDPVSTELKWYRFDEGYKKAVAENKIILVDAYTEWCGWCKVMDKKTYTDASVISKLNQCFVCIKLNPEVDEAFAFADKKMRSAELLQYIGNGQVTGFPTTIFWTNPGKDEKRYVQPGYLPPADFITLLDMAIQAKKG
jgi:thioredoxin-related protein